MKRIPDTLVDEIRNKLDIVEVISKYVSLTKRGKNYWGLSPFRDDNNPSLSVSEDKQIYMDFATHEGGNVFTFLMKIENISFVEAVIKSSRWVGVDLSEYENQPTQAINPEKKKALDVMQESSAYYEYELSSQSGVEAIEYLTNRGYDTETIKEFNVGLAKQNSNIIEFLSAKGHSEASMLEVDLVRYVEDELRPVFYNRVVFPIHDEQGHVIGYSGRTLDPNSSVKYINTKETSLYVKGKIVYNYHRAKEYARKEGCVILTEGVTDSIAFSMAGHKNVVSLLGVACTPDHIRSLKYLSHTFILAFDGDRAGIEATYNIGKRLVEAHCSVFVWYNDSGMDPDELLKKEGKSALDTGIQDKLNWLDFVLNFAIGNYGLTSYENRKSVATFFLPHINGRDAFEKDFYLKELSKRTQFEVNVLESELNQTQSKPRAQTPTKIIKVSGCSLPEKRLLAAMLLSKEAAYIYRDSLGYMIHPNANELALILLNLYRNTNKIEIARLFETKMNENTQNILTEVILMSESMHYQLSDVNELINIIKERVLKQGVYELGKQIETTASMDDQLDLLKKAMEKIRKK